MSINMVLLNGCSVGLSAHPWSLLSVQECLTAMQRQQWSATDANTHLASTTLFPASQMWGGGTHPARNPVLAARQNPVAWAPCCTCAGWLNS